jgi:ribose transport system ATP-binding protein
MSSTATARQKDRLGAGLESPLLQITGLSKAFPGQVALDNVDLQVRAGSTHALVGQNGSGKSTLIKILAGYHQPTGDSHATINTPGTPGVELHLGDGKAAEQAGIRFVHQDLGLVDMLSSVENIAMGGGFLTRRGRRIDWKAETRRATGDLFDLGFDDFSVTLPVGMLAPSQRTAVAVARALRNWEQGATLLVLDEPTASLPHTDVERLFNAIHRLKAKGVAILYVSHHLDEVFAIADEVTVLRDGQRVTTEPVAQLNHDRLIELMIGHKLITKKSSPATDGSKVLLSIRELAGGNVAGISADVVAGEIVGVAGITGSGREHVVPLITGQIPSLAGDISIDGTDMPPYDPRAVLRAGGAFVTADRARLGNLTMMSITANTTVCNVERNTKNRRLLHAQERDEAQGWMTRLGTKMASLASPIASLSGGNQQKVLFARGLRLDPTVLILDEPTRGIDVGAKEEIHSIIDEAAARGNAVLVASTDTDELVRVCHRVLVLRHGTVIAQLVGVDITSESVERAQLQSDPQLQNGTQ